MATTYYHTVNGKIRGQTTAGVRTDYLTDALGSVVATVDSSAAVVNTYRYTPYGSILSKSGSGSDPKPMWLGSLGARATRLTNAEVALRFMTYSSLSGTVIEDSLRSSLSLLNRRFLDHLDRLETTWSQPLREPTGFAASLGEVCSKDAAGGPRTCYKLQIGFDVRCSWARLENGILVDWAFTGHSKSGHWDTCKGLNDLRLVCTLHKKRSIKVTLKDSNWQVIPYGPTSLTGDCPESDINEHGDLYNREKGNIIGIIRGELQKQHPRGLYGDCQGSVEIFYKKCEGKLPEDESCQ